MHVAGGERNLHISFNTLDLLFTPNILTSSTYTEKMGKLANQISPMEKQQELPTALKSPSLSWPPPSSERRMSMAALQKHKMKQRLKLSCKAQKRFILEHFGRPSSSTAAPNSTPPRMDYQTLRYVSCCLNGLAHI